MIPTAPLTLRNRLAETILDALHDDAARATLRAVAAGDTAAGEPWTSPEARAHGATLSARAAAAIGALGPRPLTAPSSLGDALAAAATLFDAGLYFEVHELLEPYWWAARGEARDVLQGLIQIAVGYQHLANANVAGARALLAEGAGRLHGRHLDGRDLEPLARAASADARGLPETAPATAPPFPRREE